MSDESPTIDRRRFLTVLGAGSGAGALALSGCSTSQVEKLVPYLVQSEDQVPGIATWYASSCTECAAGCGLHVRTREGRAVKLEGNPEHPVNRGKLCSRGQAALQGLYNPGRIKGPMARAADGSFQQITWDDAIARLAAKLGAAGSKLAVISGAGPGTLSDLLAEWTAAFGGRLVHYEPFDHEPLRAANRQVFGLDQLPAHDFAKARYIVSFGADFLEAWLAPIENQRGFAQSHGFTSGELAKFVYAGPRMNLTGLNADQWLSIRPGSEAALALAMASVVAGQRGGGGELGSMLARYTPAMAAQETGLTAEGIERVAREFAAARPSLAVAGGVGAQYPGATELCAAVNILNWVAGNIGETVRFGAGLAAGDGLGALAQAAEAMKSGAVAVALVHNANPVYTLPKASGFAEAFKKVGYKVSTSMYLDETAAMCDLLLPQHHALERWDDVQPRAGVFGLTQPVMQPVFNTLATGDLLLRVSQKVGGPLAKLNAPSYEAYLKTRWQALAAEAGEKDFEVFWRAALQHGGIYRDPPTPPAVTLAPTAKQIGFQRPAFEGSGEFVFLTYPHALLHDGRGTNKPWLLENADPVTKITWHSWVEIGPEAARRLDVRDGEIVELTSPHGAIAGPVYVYPGLRDDVVAVPLGFGHTAYGALAEGRGVNALDLLGAPKGEFLPYVSTRVAVRKTGHYQKLASIAGVPRQLGRGIAEAMPLAAAQKGLTVEQAYLAAGEGQHEANTETEVRALKGWSAEQNQATKYGGYADEHPRWGMAIDLTKCTGCQACVTACYAENNIPTVGQTEILKGRELTWMRIERYWETGEEPGHPVSARFIPMLCQHCSNAPCEPVCPVYAAYHTPDGLNGQVYNRCVGTRYCANNCPYKVRYFNWYKYNLMAWPEPLNLQLNPDVTVRARGVMEKCTFCIQRIRGAQNDARLENRPLRDGEFTTACAQACPSDAILFGNAADPSSRVAQLKQNPRGYHVLEELNTRSAITYLAKVLHPAEA
ncbi:MAG TPA: molybdopterin-dependent oxidoreductase [Gemmatimonadales bacterium]|jgi:molybdopterin-containing oxidoreductase family iron-sulfur binding subunit